MGVHEGDGLADGLLADDGVGIEQQHILRLARPDGEVVGARKTEVVAAGDHLHLGEAGREIADGVVLGVVVHHIDLGVDAREGAAQADETLLQVVLDVVADDNDGELMGHLSLCLYKKLGVCYGCPWWEESSCIGSSAGCSSARHSCSQRRLVGKTKVMVSRWMTAM